MFENGQNIAMGWDGVDKRWVGGLGGGGLHNTEFHSRISDFQILKYPKKGMCMGSAID